MVTPIVSSPNPAHPSHKSVIAGKPKAPPLAPVVADHFDANPVQPGPAPAPAPSEMDKVNALKAYYAHKENAKLTADAIMTCLSPFVSGTGKGPVEVQIQQLLLKIMAKMESVKRDDSIELARLEQLKKALHSKDALAELKNIERSLQNESKAHSEEQNRATEGFSAITRAQHETLMSSLREMRAS